MPELLRSRRRYLTAVAALMIVALTIIAVVAPRILAGSDTDNVIQGIANCRYGVAEVPLFMTSEPWIPTLNAGWYINFMAEQLLPTPPANGAEYVSLVRFRQDVDPNGEYLPSVTFLNELNDNDLGAIVRANPGRLWVIGNEPDVNHHAQDTTYPELYARVYYTVYNFIKERDPSAKFGVAGLSMMTPGRMHYLDIVWNTYQAEFGTTMPVDVWNMHLYLLAESKPFGNGIGDGQIALGTNPLLAISSSNGDPAQCPLVEIYCRSEHDSVDVFARQVYNMRYWMKAHGQQDKPLIISEFAVLYPYLQNSPTGCYVADEFGQCFTEERVSRYMTAVSTFLENTTDTEVGYPYDNHRLVQQWLWYSLVTKQEWSGGASNLVNLDYANYPPGSLAALTLPGHTFRNLAGNPKPPTLQLHVPAIITAHSVNNQPANVHLQAGFSNTGDGPINSGPITVSFYADVALTQLIGRQTIETTTIPGCARQAFQVAAVWQNLPPGQHPYWVKLDSAAANTVQSGMVIVYPEGHGGGESEYPHRLFLPLQIRD